MTSQEKSLVTTRETEERRRDAIDASLGGERIDIDRYQSSRWRRAGRRGGAEGVIEGDVDAGRRRRRRAEGVVVGDVGVGGW